jgi:hypothetical protein
LRLARDSDAFQFARNPLEEFGRDAEDCAKHIEGNGAQRRDNAHVVIRLARTCIKDDQDDEFFRVAGVLEVMKMSLRREDKIVCMEGSSSASS